METTAVVHLARAKNGLKPFENFLTSYRRYQAGLPHEFCIVYKGFRNRDETSPLEKLLGNDEHESVFISDAGFDLRAFRKAAETLGHRNLFFLNSFSEILADNWLAKPMEVMRRNQGVGVVGATGSWESMYSNALNNFGQSSGLASKLTGFLHLKACQFCFNPFPNHHLRTNAFLISRDLMLQLWPRHIRTKRGAYLFESGKRSFTNRILRCGLRPLLVGRDGRGFEMPDWSGSNTFRNSDQENLLVADNQTRLYQTANLATRERLATLAWGRNASVSAG
jgi:hypothetical protein